MDARHSPNISLSDPSAQSSPSKMSAERKRVEGSEQDISFAQMTDPTGELQQRLKARHLSMIALGGALGTGLIIGTGAGLAKAGPAAILITYSLVGFVVFLVLGALGEIATWLPMSSGFTGYASRYVDPAMGFALGYCYWFKYLMLPPTQLTACALVIQYWVPREQVNPGVWITIFLIVIVFVNLFGVGLFGELEFWMSSIKVVIVVGLLILSLILVCGGGPDHQVYGFKYWSNPGAFHAFIQEGTTGEFLASISVLVTATYAYLGTELICVTFGEAQNPRKTIPKAIKLTFWRIAVFYILSVFFLGMLVPYNSPELLDANSASTSASASPFVVAIEIAGIQTLPAILNAGILIFVFSAANSDLYIASRTIYGLAREGLAPNILTHTTKSGVPIYSLILSSAFALLAYLNVSSDSATIFTYFTNVVTIFGVLTWMSLLVTHILFVKARRAQGITNSSMVYTAPLGLYGTYFALFVCSIIALFKNYSVFVHSDATGGDYGDFDYKNFITGYLGLPVYFIMFFGYKFFYKTKFHTPEHTDLYTGKAEIDDDEREYMEREKLEEGEGRSRVAGYYKYISWLF